MPSKQFLSYIQDENKFNNLLKKKKNRYEGGMCQPGNNFCLPLEKYGDLI